MDNERKQTLVLIGIGLLLASIIVYYNVFFNSNNYEGIVLSSNRSKVSENSSFIPQEYIKHGRININKATAEQIKDFIPEISLNISEKIVKYREEHKGFGSISELKNISGINENEFDKIYDYFYVE